MSDINMQSIDEQIKTCLKIYYQFDKVELSHEKSGMNNITRLVTLGNSKYNLRVYCNHKDIEKVKFEHLILQTLAKQSMSIKIPIPVKTVYNTTIASLEDGSLVSLYHYIEGTQKASHTLYKSLIEATAHVANALATIQLNEKPAYSPYYDLYTNYPQFDEHQLSRYFEQSKKLNSIKEKLIHLLDVRAALEKQIDIFKQLPHSLIHGDINFSNSVAVKDNIIGILDFEFITYDLRAMELAVVLIEYFKPNKPFNKDELVQLIECYCSICPLNNDEIQLLPQLIKLRAIDVAFHFLTRFTEGQDDEDVLFNIINDSFYAVQIIEDKWK